MDNLSTSSGNHQPPKEICYEAIDKFVQFSNTHVPIPKISKERIQETGWILTDSVFREVRENLSDLETEKEIYEYGSKFFDRLQVNCIGYQFSGDSEKTYVDYTRPVEDLRLLQNENPDIQDFFHDLCYRTCDILGSYFDHIYENIWHLHEHFKKGAFQEDEFPGFEF